MALQALAFGDRVVNGEIAGRFWYLMAIETDSRTLRWRRSRARFMARLTVCFRMYGRHQKMIVGSGVGWVARGTVRSGHIETLVAPEVSGPGFMALGAQCRSGRFQQRRIATSV